MASSNASSPCRIEWRPSRWLMAALVLLGLLAAVSVSFSGLPDGLRWPALLLCPAWCAMVVAREWRRPRAILCLPAGEGACSLDVAGVSLPLASLAIARRGPLLQVTCLDGEGGTHRLLWWPDTLNAQQRRALVLAVSSRAAGDSVLPLVAG